MTEAGEDVGGRNEPKVIRSAPSVTGALGDE